MASDTDCSETLLRTDEAAAPAKRGLQEVDDRLVTLSEKITLCSRVLNDLKDLSDALVRRSLQDVSLPSQK